jgi:hypothetical protein
MVCVGGGGLSWPLGRGRMFTLRGKGGCKEEYRGVKS